MRRRVLLAASASSVATLAGCGTDGTGGNPGGADAGDETSAESDGSRSTPPGKPTPTGEGGEPLAEATIATDLSAQPHLGPDPRTAESVIVDVSDPSCPTCESHHSGAFQRIRSELVEGRSTAYVVRTVGWTADWGTDACRALEATAERSPNAYWELLAFFFDEQRSLSAETVLGDTERYLDGTGVDGAAVIDAVETGAADAAVAADDEVARAAGVRSVPTFFLFRDGRLRTTLSGPKPFDAFVRALEY